MKKVLYVLLLMSFIIHACAKDYNLVSEQTSDKNTMTIEKSLGKVINVFPNNLDDTQSMIDAFAQAKAIGKDCIIKLMPGKFKISMIEVRDFYGQFTGSGQYLTSITNLPGLSPDGIIQNHKLPALITFIGGDITVSDLSVSLSENFYWIGTYEMNMLLFSDYAADYKPKSSGIKVNISNVELTGILNLNYNYPKWLHGVKLAPDILLDGGNNIKRSIIDVSINNSKFFNFNAAVFVFGCKSGKINIGTEGGNLFTDNGVGLNIHGNLGVKVFIKNNEFHPIKNHSESIDLNSGDYGAGEQYLEAINVFVGTYKIMKNIINVHQNDRFGVGLWDNWRFLHPEYPGCMEMEWENNIFRDIDGNSTIIYMFGLQNAVFSENDFVGDTQGGHIEMSGSWLAPNDPLYDSRWLENCLLINNNFLEKEFSINLNEKTRGCIIKSDLSKVTINDKGINNLVIDTN